MRILFYCHSSTLYGANRSLIELIVGIKKSYPGEFETHLILPSEGPICNELKRQDLTYTIIPHYNWIYFSEHGKRWENSKLFFELWKWKNKTQKAIKNQLNLKKHMAFARNYNPEIIYVNSSMNPMGLYVGKKLEKKIIWHHRETVNDEISGFFLEFDKFAEIFSIINKHIFPSQFLMKFYKSRFNVQNGDVVYNSPSIEIKPNSFSNRQSTFPKKIGMVGRFNNQKGQQEVIELFQHEDLRNMELHIYTGEKSLRNFSKLDNIIYHPFTEPSNIYSEIDYLIVNAKNESFGRVVIEANFYNVPVFVSNSGALPELIISGVNGDIYANMNELKSLILDNRKNYDSIQEGIKKFSTEKMIEKVYEILMKVN